jgi:hypothetical protein
MSDRPLPRPFSSAALPVVQRGEVQPVSAHERLEQRRRGNGDVVPGLLQANAQRDKRLYVPA